jgi:predicted CoA-substrate-specific enzyme activase
VSRYLVGMDVGSTTVKAMVQAAGSDEVLWHEYQRHETRQARTVHAFLRRMEQEMGITPQNARILVTGSGGADLAPLVGGRFVQEVNAVSLAVEKRHPDVQSVVELGGQDAKMLFFHPQPGAGRKKIATMNDKCAGGTGAVLDKLSVKLNIPSDRLCKQRYHGLALHRVAGKCGVFAETDINGLQKQGVPAEELMASLFDAIVLQNLTVLTRGHVLRPKVLLLGGPNTFIVGLREAWQTHIPRLWEERKISLPAGVRPADLIFCPGDGVYFAALGAIEFGREQADDAGPYTGLRHLEHFLEQGQSTARTSRGAPTLCGSDGELDRFLAQYQPRVFQQPPLPAVTRAYLGVDGGSTSSKAVLVDENGTVLAKAYRLSQGNPIQDAIDLVDELETSVASAGSLLEVLGVGTTGYAKGVLDSVLKSDVALVETVAHARSALHLYPQVDVIVDVGGQDIKLIVLKDGHVKDFMLNTQCSAGNGYFLQATARCFGLDLADYAQRAFAARRMPEFSYGCAVFLQTDIVNFQRKGWTPEEILAGLAAVLPKNIWLYVAKIPRLPALGRRFLLQGGTQRNLAAVKAQVDYIRSRFAASGVEPEIFVHEHCGEAGAIGAALEARQVCAKTGRTSFIGLGALRQVRFTTTTNESTRCFYCTNRCLRTFVDVERGDRPERIIIASCEKGAAQDARAVRSVLQELEAVKARNPNLVDMAAHSVWRSQHPPVVVDAPSPRAWMPGRQQKRVRNTVRIGIPRVFNMYLYAPFFSAYLESLGVPADNIVWSDFTSEELYRAGAGRGAVDPCFPSKVVIGHLHNLFSRHGRQPLDAIFLPMFDVIETHLTHTLGTNGCPTVIGTPLAACAAFRTDTDVFEQRGIGWLSPVVNLADTRLLARQMHECWAPLLGISPGENARAIEQGFAAQRRWQARIRVEARAVIDQLEHEERLGIVMLGRPYHHDPGLNHGLFDEFQKLGYPVLSQNTLPVDADLLARLFGDDHPLDIDDVWKHSYSASTSHKVWAAKFVARHPNLIAVEISNFKCGHDSPAYQLIERILEHAGRPYFSFKDIDENKPAGALGIRTETIDYFLKRHRPELIRNDGAGWRRDEAYGAASRGETQLAPCSSRRPAAGLPL